MNFIQINHFNLKKLLLFCRDELDSSEYEEVKQSTIEQLKEFQESLPRIAKGDVSLVSSVAAIQMVSCVNLIKHVTKNIIM